MITCVATAISNESLELAFELYFALADLAGEYPSAVDESNGYMGSAYKKAKELIEQSTPAELPEEVRESALQRLLIALAKGDADHYKWELNLAELDLAELATSLVETPAEAKRLETILDGKTFSSYAAEQSTKVRVKLKRRFGKAGIAEDFEATQIHLPSVRQRLIEAAFAKTNYAEPRRLAGQGLPQHESEHQFGWVADWQEWLLKIAKAEGDRAKTIELCRLDASTVDSSRQGYF